MAFHHNSVVVRDTLIDFFRDLSSAHGEFLVHDDGFRSRSHSYQEVGAAARGFAAPPAAAGLRKGDKVVFYSENRPEWIVAFWGCLLNGDRRRADRLPRVAGLSRPRRTDRAGQARASSGRTAAGRQTPPARRRGSCTSSNGRRSSRPRARPRGRHRARRRRRDHLHLGRDRRAQGRRDHPPQRPGEHRARRAGGPEVPQVGAAVLPAALPEPAAAQPHVRAGDGDVHSADAAGRRRFHARLQPGATSSRRSGAAASRCWCRCRRFSTCCASTCCALAPELATPGPKQHFAWRWWRYRQIHRRFGFKFWAFVVGAAPLEAELEAFWGELGFAVIQGYGLTETAPIVTLNHPFGTKRGSVGKAIAGVEGEDRGGRRDPRPGRQRHDRLLQRRRGDRASVRGRLVPHRRHRRGRRGRAALHPRAQEGDDRHARRAQRLSRGRRARAQRAAGRDAIRPWWARARTARSACTRCVVLEPGVDADAVAGEANAAARGSSENPARASSWPEQELPRTEGTRKLKRALIRDWVKSGGTPQLVHAGQRSAGRAARPVRRALRYRAVDDARGAGLELARTRRADGGARGCISDADRRRRVLGRARRLVSCRTLVEQAGHGRRRRTASRSSSRPGTGRWPARTLRRLSLPTWILPLARVFAWITVEGTEHLKAIDGPVIFAANHQSHMDTPVILAALPARAAVSRRAGHGEGVLQGAFLSRSSTHAGRGSPTASTTIWRRSSSTRSRSRSAKRARARRSGTSASCWSDGFSVLIFPEGRRSDDGEIRPFRPGIGMIASRLGVPVVPVRIDGLDKVLHHTWQMATPGPVRVAFGAPLELHGEDYEALACGWNELFEALAVGRQGGRDAEAGRRLRPIQPTSGSAIMRHSRPGGPRMVRAAHERQRSGDGASARRVAQWLHIAQSC